MTEEVLASLRYADTIVFRPGFLEGAERGSVRLGENMLEYVMNDIQVRLLILHRAVTGVLKRLSNKLTINVKVLGKAIALAGLLGSERLPEDVHASEISFEGHKCTLIDNAGAVRLGEVDEAQPEPEPEPVASSS